MHGALRSRVVAMIRQHPNTGGSISVSVRTRAVFCSAKVMAITPPWRHADDVDRRDLPVTRVLGPKASASVRIRVVARQGLVFQAILHRETLHIDYATRLGEERRHIAPAICAQQQAAVCADPL